MSYNLIGNYNKTVKKHSYPFGFHVIPTHHYESWRLNKQFRLFGEVYFNYDQCEKKINQILT